MSLARPETETSTPISELPISERAAAFNKGFVETERARLKLFEEGEKALADGIGELRRGVVGERTTVFRYGNPVEVLREALQVPDWHSQLRGKVLNDFSFPGEFKGLLEAVVLREYVLNKDRKQTGDDSGLKAKLWLETPTGFQDLDSLTIGSEVGTERFALRMDYKRKPTYYLTPERKDHEIVTFSGHYSQYFERYIDGIKALNGLDAFRKLGAGLAFTRLIADLRAPK